MNEGPEPDADADSGDPMWLGFSVTSKRARMNSSPRLTIVSVCWPCEDRLDAEKNWMLYVAPVTPPGAVYRVGAPPSMLYSETCAMPGGSRGRTTPKTDIFVPGYSVTLCSVWEQFLFVCVGWLTCEGVDGLGAGRVRDDVRGGVVWGLHVLPDPDVLDRRVGALHDHRGSAQPKMIAAHDDNSYPEEKRQYRARPWGHDAHGKEGGGGRDRQTNRQTGGETRDRGA